MVLEFSIRAPQSGAIVCASSMSLMMMFTKANSNFHFFLARLPRHFILIFELPPRIVLGFGQKCWDFFSRGDIFSAKNSVAIKAYEFACMRTPKPENMHNHPQLLARPVTDSIIPSACYYFTYFRTDHICKFWAFCKKTLSLKSSLKIRSKNELVRNQAKLIITTTREREESTILQWAIRVRKSEGKAAI